MRRSSAAARNAEETRGNVYELPPLPYPKGALEPFHRGYLRKLERILGAERVAETGIEALIRQRDGKVFDLAAQVWNHTAAGRPHALADDRRVGARLLPGLPQRACEVRRFLPGSLDQLGVCS